MLSLTSPATSINTLGANRAAHRQKRELERGAEKNSPTTRFSYRLTWSGWTPASFGVSFVGVFVDFVFPVGEKEAKTASKYVFYS